MGLSSIDGNQTILGVADIEKSDWLAGTVEAVYGTDKPSEIALKDHLAGITKMHPSQLQALPLNNWDYNIESADDKIVVKSDGSETVDLTAIKKFWSGWFDKGSWPVEDLFYSLANKFVRVVMDDPAAMEKIQSERSLIWRIIGWD